MRLRYVIFAFLVIGVIALIFYRISKNKSRDNVGGSKGEVGKGGAAPLRVSGVIVMPQSFSNTISAKGSIDANEQVQIRSQVSGIVTDIYFKEGSKVSKGQELLKVDNSELRAQLSDAATKEKLAVETEQRARLLFEKEAISREEYEIAQAGLKSLQAQSQLVKAQLAKTSITAPFSGKIGLRYVSEGELLSPTTVVANLVNTDPAKVTFSIPEKYASQVKVNTKLSFTVSGSDEKYTATVYALEPVIETTTRTQQIRAFAPNADGSLIPGSFANVELPLSRVPDAILIPTEAIIPIQNGKKVFIAELGKAKEVMVETSTRTEKEILILSGLKTGDTVLTSGVMSLKSGTPVSVTVGKNK